MYELSGRWQMRRQGDGPKLTESMVRKIRALAESIESGSARDKARDVQAELLLYDVSVDAIRNVIMRESFAWIN